eukprot:TRINITY_DN12080_c0_g1_i1.p1 TRINITY_DN12080_c0_g1~~TRINITY_DN12080_c0_g1_i1.p1  ORF type:complete len:1104 (+),score=175.81 TRINITY_DN12080_c0_g1_i1:477-3788(+)
MVPTVAAAARAAATASSDATAVVDHSGMVLTYRQLVDAAEAVANELRRQQCTCAGLFVEEGPELVVAMLAFWAAEVPFITLDRRWPAARVKSLLDMLRVDLCVVDSAHRPSGDPLSRHLDVLRGEVACTTVADLQQGLGGPAVPSAVRHSVCRCGVAYYVTTSGTTGTPKIVETSHAALMEAARGKAGEEFSDGDPARVLLLASHPTFDPCQVDVAAALLAGAALAAPPRSVLTGFALGGVLRDLAVTHVCCTPTHWRMVPGSARDYPSLVGVSLGGEAFPAEYLRKHGWLDARGTTGSPQRIVFRNTYGLTEGTGYQTSCVVASQDGLVQEPRCVGWGFGTYSLSVQDGEVVVRGAGLSRRFELERQCPASGGMPAAWPRVLHTGDYGRATDAGVVLLGRRDGVVKVRGQRMSLEELDAVLSQCAWVHDVRACVVTSPDGDAVGALIHPDPALPPCPQGALVAGVRAYAKAHLPPVQVPVMIAVVCGEAWQALAPELGAAGKVNRAAVARAVEQRHEDATLHVPLDTALECVVADAWMAAGMVARGAALGATHDFTTLGGNSLTALRVANYLRAHTERDAVHAQGARPITAFDGVASMLVAAEAPEAAVCELADVMGPYAPCELLARPVLRSYAQFLAGEGVVVAGAAEDPGPRHVLGTRAAAHTTHARAVLQCTMHSVHAVLETLLLGRTHAEGADDGHWGPMHEAVARGDGVALRLLLAAGWPCSRGVLHVAAARGDAAALAQLIPAAGAAEIAATDEDQQTLLHLAARSGAVQAVAAVLDAWAALQDAEQDALKHAADAGGHTALRWAIENGHADVQRALIARGCRAESSFERTLLAPCSEERRANESDGGGEYFGRMKRKNRGAPRAIAHRKTHQDDSQLQDLFGIVTDAAGGVEDKVAALGVMRNLCCAVKAHRLGVVGMGILVVLKGFLAEAVAEGEIQSATLPSALATQAVGLLRNLAHEKATKEEMVALGVIPVLADLVRCFPENHEATWRAVSALGHLSSVNCSWPALLESNVLRYLLSMSPAGAKHVAQGFPSALVAEFHKLHPEAAAQSTTDAGRPAASPRVMGAPEAEVVESGPEQEEGDSPVDFALFDE